MTGAGGVPAGAEFQPAGHAPDEVTAQFAARVAHDFNNLLTGILGNLELLQLRAARQNLPGLDAYLDGANSASSRAVALAARLMLYSGHGGSSPAPVAADELLSGFTTQAACRLNAGDAAILCDPAQLELALAELLANAKAAGGAPIITTAASPQEIIITISDDGHGMGDDILARACEPFFTTANNGTGRGLGLAIVARVMRDAGGRMAIKARENAGCTVTLWLPRA